MSTYTVSKGDTLWGLSRKYKTTVRKLAADNNIKNVRHIGIGQKLNVPGADDSFQPAPKASNVPLPDRKPTPPAPVVAKPEPKPAPDVVTPEPKSTPAVTPPAPAPAPVSTEPSASAPPEPTPPLPDRKPAPPPEVVSPIPATPSAVVDPKRGLYGNGGEAYDHRHDRGPGPRGTFVKPPGGPKDWIDQAFTLLNEHGIDTSRASKSDILRIMGPESTWRIDPKPMHDRNWFNNHPNYGIMQMIQSTFDNNSVGEHTNILNPIDNIASATQYILKQYHSTANHPGIRSMNRGKGYIGY